MAAGLSATASAMAREANARVLLLQMCRGAGSYWGVNVRKIESCDGILWAGHVVLPPWIPTLSVATSCMVSTARVMRGVVRRAVRSRCVCVGGVGCTCVVCVACTQHQRKCRPLQATPVPCSIVDMWRLVCVCLKS